jgi:hypothetical protein
MAFTNSPSGMGMSSLTFCCSAFMCLSINFHCFEMFSQMPPKQMLRVYDYTRRQKRLVVVEAEASGLDVLNAGMSC